MPHCLMTCGSLEELTLDLVGCGLRLPNFMGFPVLRVLDLTCVDLLEDDDLVKDFIRRFLLLEDLHFTDCVITKLDYLRISCLKLKNLKIDNMPNVDLCGGIKICCPKLVKLFLSGPIASNYFFEGLNSLKEAVIEPELIGNTISLFPGICNVKTLSIDIDFFHQCVYAARDPTLPKLKTLELSTTNDAFIFDKLIQILKHYPRLDSLKLMFKEDLYEADPRRMFTRDMKRVKLLEFIGEKPKSDTVWDEFIMVFSWGNKAKYI